MLAEIRGVAKQFGEGETLVRAVNDVSLDVFAGEVLLLAGPSGCGKTTLLSLIAGLLDPDRGSLRVCGRQLNSMSGDAKSAFRREHIGFIFQQFNLIPVLSAVENVEVPLLIRRTPKKAARRTAEQMLKQVGLAHRMKCLPGKLSGGEQQRVAIARALAPQPRLLICDEPTAALDGETGSLIMENIRAACEPSRGVIVVTHDSRVFHFGDRIARMADGRIVSVQARDAHSESAPRIKPVTVSHALHT